MHSSRKTVVDCESLPGLQNIHLFPGHGSSTVALPLLAGFLTVIPLILVADRFATSSRAGHKSSSQSDLENSQLTFFSNSPEVSPKDPRTDGNLRDYRQDLVYTDATGGLAAPASRYRTSVGASNAQIAPWATDPPTTNAGGGSSGSFFDDGPGRLPASPSFRPDTARTGASDSPDPLFYGDERRPSMASATTVSSSNSNPRASMGRSTRHMKIANIFGDDGHESARGSDTSILASGHRDQSSSSLSHRDRNNSIHTIHNDRRPISPTSSRPRTPVPSSDVTPWLFQDFKVSRTLLLSHANRRSCADM